MTHSYFKGVVFMNIRCCGINSTHPHGIKIKQPTGFGDYLFLRLKTPTRFYINGEIYDAEPNDIILYSKGYPQFYENIENSAHIDDYMFFDVDNEEEQLFLNNLNLKFDRILRLPDTRQFINVHQLICMESINKNVNYDESINCLLRYFLIKLSDSMNLDFSNRERDIINRLNELRLMIYSSPSKKWTVTDMANYVNYSPSYFQSIYKKVFHISCIADLTNSRISHAKEMLSTTQLPINEIAKRCGYDSNIYFARHFKRNEGLTPTAYRNRTYLK